MWNNDFKYTVRDVVCDYGVYENDNLKLICNSRRIALKIADLMNYDYELHRALQENREPPKEPDGQKHAHLVPSVIFDGVSFCSECRKHLDDTANYCEWCGAKIDEVIDNV